MSLPLPRDGRILIVDDNEDGAEMLSELLQMAGYETRTAGDGASALTLAREFLPKVVLLDLGLPVFDGFETAKLLRAEASLGRVELVAVTGFATPADRKRTADAGFDAHLVKPVNFDLLLAVLAKGERTLRPEPASAP